MKQLQMTPELSALIKSRVGEDVDTNDLAVFEAIALNTKPLPGKDGTIFEGAVTRPVTLAQMADYITSGNHLPLIIDHYMDGAPKGRFFEAGLFSETNDLDDLELHALFYLDSTEETLIAKLNSASLDEVSVSFLPSAFLCSDCGFDYFSQGTPENIATRTCDNGHTIGEDGVHAELVGLSKFIELSLVARGAADKPKILGKSQSKLTPESVYRLAAKGFETEALVVQASLGKEDEMDTTKLVADLSDAKADLKVSLAENTRLTSEKEALQTQLTAAEEKVSELEAKVVDLEAADKTPEDYESSKAERDEATAFLGEQLNKLRVALGEDKLDADKLPATVAELKAEIESKTGNLTALLPTDGVTNNGKETVAARDFAQFKTK